MIHNNRLNTVFLRAAVSIILITGIVLFVDWSTIGRLVATARIEPILMALFLVIIQQLLSSLKLAIALSEHNPGIMKLLGINLITTFFMNLLPTSVVGDIIRVAYFQNNHSMRERATAAVVINRYTGLVAQVLLICLFSLFSLKHDGRLLYLSGLSAAALIMIGAVSILLHIFRRQFQSLVLRKWRFSRFFDLNVTVIAIRDLFKDWKRFGYILVVSLIYQLSVLWTIVLITAAFGVKLQFYCAASISFAATCVAMLPVSIAGWGIFELTYTGLYSLMTEHKEVGTLVSLGVRALMVVPSLAGMILFIHFRRTNRKIGKSVSKEWRLSDQR